MEQERKKWKEKEENLSAFDRMKGWIKKAFLRMILLFSDLCTLFWTVITDGKKAKMYVKAVVLAASFAGIVFFSALLSSAEFPLRVRPVGFALIAALGGGKRWLKSLSEKKARLLESAGIVGVFCGVLFSCFFFDEKYGILYLISYLGLFIGRMIFTKGEMDEGLLARITSASASGTGTGLALALLDGFTLNRMFAAVCFGILTPLISYLLCGFYIFTGVNTVGDGAKTKKRVYLEAGIFTIVYLFLYAIRETVWWGFSLPFVLTVVLTLFVAREKGALYGAAMGMIGGMACAASPVAPALAVAGFFSGLFFEYSSPVALMISFVAAGGYSMYSEGFQAFRLVAADFIAGLLVFLPFGYLIGKETAEIPVYPRKDLMHKETMRSARKKLKNMSEAFSSLSEVFYTVSESMKKPQLTEVSRLVSDCCSEICSRCTLSGLCWGKEHSVHVEATSRAAARLLSSGQVQNEDFGEPFSSGCKNLKDLKALINRRYEDMNGSFFKNNKTRLLAGEYSSVARLLKNTAGELDQELEYNPKLEIRAKKVLKELGIDFRRVAVFGTREIKIDVYGILLERVSLASMHIVEKFEKEFECEFDAPGFFMFEESVVMRLRRRRKLALECAKSGCAKKGETVNGDSVSFFETDRDYFYTLICDGMGSGREAAFTSRLASIFIEKLMHCASPKNVTLEMLNAFLMSKTDETFTTVDLLEVDLLSGEANFMKAGAAPSFVLRGDRLHRIESRTPPAGVLSRMCAEQTSFRLKAGDYILLLSDGAEENGEGAGWLMELFAETNFSSAGALCEAVFRKAKEKSQFRDDLSVSVVRVMNAK